MPCRERLFVLGLLAAMAAWMPRMAVASDPATTIQQAEQVLAELVAIPARRIPQRLLAEAQGVAVIPRVIKVGFIAGVRRGHGVVMTRDAEGEWSLPQFITLTGGSVGWQAGIQGTDVVLVFKTRASVDSLLKGKFTIGADAAAAAGPVGRNAAAATDVQLRAEILSYSRSRGLFAGVSIDGTVLEINQAANAAFYGAPSTEFPQRIPQAASDLQLYLTELTQAVAPAPAGGVAPPVAAVSATRLEAIQDSLYLEGAQLHAILSPEWQQYLALPAEVEPPGAADLQTLNAVYKRYARVSVGPEYQQLTQRPEFQTTYELLREYVDALSAGAAMLQLPKPPSD